MYIFCDTPPPPAVTRERARRFGEGLRRRSKVKKEEEKVKKEEARLWIRKGGDKNGMLPFSPCHDNLAKDSRVANTALLVKMPNVAKN